MVYRHGATAHGDLLASAHRKFLHRRQGPASVHGAIVQTSVMLVPLFLEIQNGNSPIETGRSNSISCLMIMLDTRPSSPKLLRGNHDEAS